jgi:two-component system phosphate regulon sensor histidine kinase PhoR
MLTQTITAPLEKIVDALTTQQYDQLEATPSSHYEIEKLMHSLTVLLSRITESNTALQEERNKVEMILANMSEGFVLVDHDKNILLCNTSARTFFGINPDEKPENVMHLSHSVMVIDALQNAIANDQSSVFDLTILEKRTARFHISPSGESGAVMLIVDVTDEKQLEQQKQDFFSTASHELKTPITSILGFSQMLSSGMVENNSEIITRIETEARRLSELINDILTVSRLELNQMSEERTDLNFGDIVREAAESLSGSTIKIHLDVDDVIFHADKRHLYELCTNLIENAVKYNKPDGTVNVSLSSVAGVVTLCVKDTGIGIPLEYQTRIFERFFRVDFGRDKKLGGVGLGLFIVKHIVELYDGSISLKSSPDEGTEIIVRLPL